MPLATELRYTFAANFSDGSRFDQNSEDVSLLDPSKSSYWDLSQIIERGMKLDSFFLYNLEGAPILAVDLKTGLFSYSGVLINAQPRSRPLPPGGTFELIYFRDHLATLNSATGEAMDSHVYRIGWRYRVETESFEQTLVIE